MRRSHAFRIASLAAIGSLCLTGFPVPVQSASAPTMQDALDLIARYAPQALREQGAPGMSVALTDRTRTLRIITVGYSNLDAKAPVTPQTRFPIGSITKGMTATALMELRDEGRLDVNESVTAYLPWFSIHSGRKTIYVHQLMSHTAGFPDDFSLAPGYGYSVAALRDAHTIFTPGTSWSYANDGFATLGAVLAAVDGRPWREAVAARVFQRLGMTDTSAVFTPQTLATTANGYTFEDPNAIAPPDPVLISAYPGDFVDPAGSVISTPGDMAKYLRFLLRGGINDEGERVLSRSSYALMTTPDTMNGKPAGPAGIELAEAPLIFKYYGYGLGLHTEDGEKMVGHTGGIAGYTACMEADVTRGFGAIAMSNLVEAPMHPCAIVLFAVRVLRAQALGQPLPPLPAAKPLYLDRTRIARAASYAGTYRALTGGVISIVAAGSALFLKERSGAKPLYPRGAATFYVDDPRFAEYGLTFTRNKAGKVDQVFSGDRWFANAAYTGPRRFSYPPAWNALLGRYETLQFWGTASSARIFELKGHLTMDGAQLQPQRDGSFKLGDTTVRFDTAAGGKMQRMSTDAIRFYRIELP
jgi:CubicO group peptidase (beta-lactamase class C family)